MGVRVAEGQGRWAFARNRLVEGLSSAAAPAGLMLQRSVAVPVAVKGKVCDARTHTATVGELLSAMGIEPSGNGRVAPPPGAPLSRAVPVRGDLIESRTGTVTEDPSRSRTAP